jgi:putative membrane protein
MYWLFRTTESGRARRHWWVLAASALIALMPVSVLAHSGPPPVPETLWSTWNLDPFVLLVLSLAVLVYVRGVRAIWARAGRGNGVRPWQFATGLAGYFTIAVALISPLDPLGTALFSAHMGQHILLIMIAPLLLILADVSSASIWGLPSNVRRSIPALWRQSGPARPVWGLIARPLPALALHSLVLWAWHVPVLYDAAIRIEFIHWVEHLTMFGSAALFWWVALQRGRNAAMNYGVGLLMLFGLVLQKTALGALLSFSPTPWYSEYSASTAAWGLTPFEDQQLAGAVLMGPGGFIYLIVGVTLFAGWFRALERSMDQQENLSTPTLATESGANHGTKETV